MKNLKLKFLNFPKESKEKLRALKMENKNVWDATQIKKIHMLIIMRTQTFSSYNSHLSRMYIP